jgi:hypothetical protein
VGPRRRGAHRGRVLRLALWTPDPGVAWLRVLRPFLERETALAVVDAPPAGEVDADLSLYHLADDPRHGFVLRALRERPGLVLLEEWDLHRLVLAETAGRGERDAWRAIARRAGGDTGAFVAEALARGEAGPWLPALLPLAVTVLGDALGTAAFTADGHGRLAALRPGFPLAHLPLPLVSAAPRPDRAGGSDRFVVAVRPPSAAPARARVERALAALRDLRVERRDVPPGDDAAEVVAGAGVLVALDDPSSGRVDPALGLALHAGVPALVTAGTAAAHELPEGVVARVSPGETEGAELRALVARLASDGMLRARLSALARAHAAEVADPGRAAAALLALVRSALASGARRPATRARGLAAAAVDEARWSARSAGLPGAPADVAVLVAALFPSGH